jgi:Glycosyl transferase family 2
MQQPEEEIANIEYFLGVLDQMPPSSDVFAHASQILDTHLLQPPNGTLKASLRGPEQFLTIAMATYDEYDATFFTVNAIRMYHPEIADETAILVLDNHPSGPCAPALKSLDEKVQGYRYVPYDGFKGTTVRDFLFREANSEFVLVMDAHVLFAPGALAKLVAFLKTQRHSRDLFQGPLVSEDLKPFGTHFNPIWSRGMYGQWGFDERATDPDAPPFEIPMQGLGVFACRKQAWPGLNPRLQGFGGEEGYLHDKIRANGGKVMCLPFLRWLHRFRAAGDIPYPVSWRDRVRNYLIAYDELGLDNAPVREHFESLLGAEAARPLIEATLQEIAGPYYGFDAIFAIDGDPARYQELLGSPVRRVAAPKTPWNPEIGRVLAHRSILAEAVQQDLRRILVVEGDPVREVSYESADFERALAQLPETPTKIALWLRKQGTHGFGVRAFGCNIRVATACLEARTILERYVFPSLPRTESAADQSDMDQPDVFVRIDRVAEQLQLSVDDVVLASAGRTIDLVPALIRVLDDAVIKRLTTLRAVHAGTVVLGDRALLLPGATHAGKSSLVAELLRRGATYFSDEYALIDSQGRVHPYPRPLLLRNGCPEQVPVLAGECNASVGDAPAPVGWILSLEYQPGGAWSVTLVPQSEGLLTLLRNTPHVLAESPEMVGAFQRTVAGATCYAGRRTEAKDAAGEILRLAGSSS